VYGTSVCLPTSLRTEQPVLGADPPWVFKRWRNVVLVKKLPPGGPASVPIDCNKRQGMAPLFGQLWSEPAGIDCSVFPHTLLLSKELCQLTLPNGSGFGANWLGLVSAKEVCDYLHVPVKTLTKRVAWGVTLICSPVLWLFFRLRLLRHTDCLKAVRRIIASGSVD
jgi:hypothetical protein